MDLTRISSLIQKRNLLAFLKFGWIICVLTLFVSAAYAQTFPTFLGPYKDSNIQTPCAPAAAEAVSAGIYFLAGTSNDGNYDVNLYYGDYPFTFGLFQTITSQNISSSSATCAPALAAFNNAVYLAFVGAHGNLNIWKITPTTNEAPYATLVASIAGLNITTSPGMGVFGSTLYIVYGSGSTNALSKTTTTDGVHFTSTSNFADVNSGAAPALVAFGGTFYMTFQQNNSAHDVWIDRTTISALRCETAEY